jgi:BASS family bile acid:Na+ symporter
MKPLLPKLRALISPLAILVMFALGVFFPHGQKLQSLTRYVIMAMLLLSYLPIRLTALKLRRSHGRLLLANLIIGTAPWLILRYVGGAAWWAQLCFFTGITPTATAAPVVIGFMHGNVTYTLTAFLLDNVGIAASLVGLLPLVCGTFSAAFIFAVLTNLGLTIGVPLLLSRGLRRTAPQLTEKIIHSPVTPKISFALWLLLLYIVSATAADFLQREAFPLFDILKIAGVSLLICAVSFGVGYVIGERGLRRESCQCLGQKNNSLGVYIALQFGSPLLALGPTFYMFWHNIWNGAQIYYSSLGAAKTAAKT